MSSVERGFGGGGDDNEEKEKKGKKGGKETVKGEVGGEDKRGWSSAKT